MATKKTTKKAPKKTVKRATGRKTAAKRATKKPAAKAAAPKRAPAKAKPVASPRARRVRSRRDKISIVLKNLVLFGILFIVSVAVASVTNNETLDTLFWILAILTAFVAVAFLIILLVFVFMRQIKK